MARRRLPVTWRAFHLPKRGNTAAEYEDAFAANPEGGRFGIADGASESSFAGLWARLLAEDFSNGDAQGASRSGWLKALQQRWSATVDGLSLPWYAEMKREEGAFATFLGLSMRQRGRGRGTWHALAVGDSCLFQIRADRLLAAFPVVRSEDFGTRPFLLGSRPRQGSGVRGQESGAEKASASSDSRLLIPDTWPQVRLRRRSRWLAGDRFLFMTDALAQWFLQQAEIREKPWQPMERILRDEHDPSVRETPDASFAGWVERLRDQVDLRNDDVTLLVLQM